MVILTGCNSSTMSSTLTNVYTNNSTSDYTSSKELSTVNNEKPQSTSQAPSSKTVTQPAPSSIPQSTAVQPSGTQTPSSPPAVSKPADTQPEVKEVTVYITKTGEKYHTSGCRYLSKSKIPISLDNAKKQGYTPCSVCNPPR